MNEKNVIKCTILLGLIILLILPSTIGWSINPAKWTIYAKEDHEIEIKEWPLELENDGSATITVQLSVIEPQYTYDGFIKMKNLSWVSLTKEKVVIPPGEKDELMVKIDVSNESSNYNKSMEFWIFADQTEGAGNIQTDYNCRWMYISPQRYVPENERPGYFPMEFMGIIFGVLGSIIVIVFIILKKGTFSRGTINKTKPKPSTDDGSNTAPIAENKENKKRGLVEYKKKR